MELQQFLQEAEAGVYGIPPMQRALRCDPKFSSALMDSSYRGLHPGSMLIWVPPPGENPSGGRYGQEGGGADRWILDGQQRATAYLGAFGRRPGWFSAERWEKLGGPKLEVAVVFGPPENVSFRPYVPGKAGHVRLADLVGEPGGDMRRLLADAAYNSDDGRLLDAAHEVRARLLIRPLAMEWLQLDGQSAAENFVRRNPNLRPEERALCSLSIACEELQRDYVDPLVRHAGTTGLGKTITRKQVNQVLQDLLPPAAQRQHGRWADPEVIRHSAQRTDVAVRNIIVFLHDQGVVADPLLWSQAPVRLLGVLFDRFPQTTSASFPWRWLARSAVGHLFARTARGRSPVSLIRTVQKATEPQEAFAALASWDFSGPPPEVTEDDLARRSLQGRRTWGAAGTLYAMACARQVAGPVVDLAEPSMVFPDPRMQPRPLWTAVDARMTLSAWAFLSSRSEAAISEAGGWNRSAFEALDTAPGRLAGHQLTRPRHGIGDDAELLLKERTSKMLDTINRFLAEIGDLNDAARAEG
ncbi:hypothetical protein [Streptomyces sp. NPDC059788]|uniref:hypothetical protein n=1 Tax=Streptomyces sp. NPDC059788 TaxID=3346948 RepID=UPI00364692FD